MRSVRFGLGTLHCWVKSDDSAGDHIHRVYIGDWHRREQGFEFRHRNLAKAVDGVLCQVFRISGVEAETVVDSYFSSCQGINGQSCYAVTIRLVDGQKISASAGSEGLAVFGALWNHYRRTHPQIQIDVLGTLGQQLKTVQST